MSQQWQGAESPEQGSPSQNRQGRGVEQGQGGSSSMQGSSRSWQSSGGSSASGRQQSELIWQNRLQKQLHEAEQNLADGALTAGYKADPREIVALLNRALASEWAAFLQYWHHYFMASDIHSAEVKGVFKEHAEDEYEHARLFGERVQQLGGVPC
ncbi:MAG TPA: ferritin-like domain-containing protein, partial [Chloroflexota bacterium]|nr:ferritin-like domain-containing protein [Chloroflexota bacterium]